MKNLWNRSGCYVKEKECLHRHGEEYNTAMKEQCRNGENSRSKSDLTEEKLIQIFSYL